MSTQNSALKSVTPRNNQLADIAAAPIKRGFFFLDDTELKIVWAFAQRKRCTPHFEATELGNRIATSMRKRIPVSGQQWDKFLTVYLKPGADIPAHQHKRHAVLYYPEATKVVIGSEPVDLGRGEMLYLPPGTLHSVPRVTAKRLSVAMLVACPI